MPLGQVEALLFLRVNPTWGAGLCGGLAPRPLGSTSYCQEAGLVEATGLCQPPMIMASRARQDLRKEGILQGQEQ